MICRTVGIEALSNGRQARPAVFRYDQYPGIGKVSDQRKAVSSVGAAGRNGLLFFSFLSAFPFQKNIRYRTNYAKKYQIRTPLN